MSNWENISYDEFLEISNQNPPNKLIKTTFELFSTDNESKDFKINDLLFYFLLFLFSIGLFGVILKLPRIFIGIISLTYTPFLSILVASLFMVVILNNRRLKKIMKLLG